MPSLPWTLEQSQATLLLGRLLATIDVHSLELGLTKLNVDSTPHKGNLWQITGAPQKLSQKTIEAFIRGNDLIARYQELKDKTEGCPFRTTVYWTAAPNLAAEATIAQLSLTISVETDLLDSHPEVYVTTQISVDEVLCVQCTAKKDPVAQEIEQDAKMLTISIEDTASCLVLYRLAGSNFSLAEMVHPDDFRELELVRPEDGMAYTKWRLLGQFLEKGVIRRARMNAVLLPREDDVVAASDVFQLFAESEAVLTA